MEVVALMNNKHPSVFSAGHFHAPKIHRPTKKKKKRVHFYSTPNTKFQHDQ